MMQPPRFTRYRRNRTLLFVFLILSLIAFATPMSVRGITSSIAPDPANTNTIYIPVILTKPAVVQPNAVTYWGMNLYLSKRERLGTGDNLPLLATTAQQASVQWTREELPWDLIEPANNSFQTVYDDSLNLAAESGFGIIGMLLTPPRWARDPACLDNFWCPPANVNEFAEFAAWMVERYDSDGVQDAPGSPRIAAWEIWNEPNDTALWPDISADPNARKLRYGQMLVAAYAAIKAADPTATVLIGGVYIYDGSCTNNLCDGFNFLNAAGGVFQQLPNARQAFDVFAIHPYIPTDRPDAPQIPGVITVEGRIIQSRNWLNNDIGRPDAPIWITEIGWCTTGGACPGGVAVSEDQQADYLIRSMVIAQQTGVQHTSWFQFEDAFNDGNRIWSNAAIVRNYNGSSYAPKPAYVAYQVLASQLRNATPDGTGPVHTHVYNPSIGSGNVGDHTYNYRYSRDGGATTIDVLWNAVASAPVSFPVAAGKSVMLVDRAGVQTSLTPVNGVVALTLTESPVLIVQTN
jgi:hypothetical protein